MFTYRNDGELSVRCYLIDPKTIDDMDRAVYWGNSAAQYIKDCEDMINQLKQYQQKIYERVQQLEAAQYHHRVTLLRENRYYQKRVFYYLIVEKCYIRISVTLKTVWINYSVISLCHKHFAKSNRRRRIVSVNIKTSYFGHFCIR
jgi:hypothetical protein